jgi:hypothetical protein
MRAGSARRRSGHSVGGPVAPACYYRGRPAAGVPVAPAGPQCSARQLAATKCRGAGIRAGDRVRHGPGPRPPQPPLPRRAPLAALATRVRTRARRRLPGGRRRAHAAGGGQASGPLVPLRNPRRPAGPGHGPGAGPEACPARADQGPGHQRGHRDGAAESELVNSKFSSGPLRLCASTK